MFNSTILDVAIGMIFVYLLLSLLCSAANEIVELFLKKRASDLERGVRELLEPQGASGAAGLVKKLYNHPLINGLFPGKYENSRITSWWRYVRGTKLPSYIPARNFALALMDLIMPGTPAPDKKSGATDATAISGTTPTAAAADTLATLRAAVQTIKNPQLEQALIPLIDAAGNDVARARANIEEWFDSSMDRVSGWYKRRSQLIVLVMGFVVAIAVNADSVIIAKKLSSDRALRESLVNAADAYAKASSTASPSPATPPKSGSTTNPPAGTTSGPATNPPASTASGSTPSTTPTPTPTPTPAATPTKPTGDDCWKKTDECKSDPNSLACKAKEDECRLEQCWINSDSCKDKDSAACKLKESTCRLEGLGLPIGWPNDASGQSTWPGLRFWDPVDFVSRWYPHFRLHFFGWLLTALAISLGAPFWFDLLNKFIVVRSTVKPKEKRPEEKPKG
jgi:hypothetical protein